MNDLTPQARALLDAAKGTDSPGRVDRARIKRGVLMQVALIGATATATGGAAAMSLATKITLVGFSVAAIGAGAVWKWSDPPAISAPAPHRHTTTPRPANKPPTVAPIEEGIAAVEPERPATATETRKSDIGKAMPRRPGTIAKPAEESPPPSTTHLPLDPELSVLRLAQDDLRAGLPAQALRRLQEFDRRFGPGSLGQERQAIMAIAHCRLSLGDEAKARAKAFLRSAPDSPLAARVRAACEPSTAPANQTNETGRPREP